MPSDPTMLWNAVLSLAIGGFLWWMRGIAAQLSDLRNLISVTREDTKDLCYQDRSRKGYRKDNG